MHNTRFIEAESIIMTKKSKNRSNEIKEEYCVMKSNHKHEWSAKMWLYMNGFDKFKKYYYRGDQETSGYIISAELIEEQSAVRMLAADILSLYAKHGIKMPSESDGWVTRKCRESNINNLRYQTVRKMLCANGATLSLEKDRDYTGQVQGDVENSRCTHLHSSDQLSELHFFLKQPPASTRRIIPQIGRTGVSSHEVTFFADEIESSGDDTLFDKVEKYFYSPLHA